MLAIHGANQNVPSKESADAFTLKMDYQEFNTDGNLSLAFSTPHLTHYAKNDSAKFVNPEILMFNRKNQPWHISALRGHSEQGSKHIYLQEEVVIHQPKQGSIPETTITTTSLEIFPYQSYAITTDEATLNRPDEILQGKGIAVDFKKGTIKLMSQGKGLYLPANNL